MNETLVFKANLRFCRVHVHVNILEWDGHEQNRDWKSSRRENATIRLTDRVKNDLVAHESPVNEKEHRTAVVLLNVRPRSEYVDSQPGPAKVFLVLHQLLEQIAAEDLKDAVAEIAGRRSGEHFKRPALQREMNFRKGEPIMRAVH